MKTTSQEAREKVLKKKKQALGAKVYTGYVGVFCFMMTLSVMGLLPEFEFEKQLSYDMLKETSANFRGTFYIPFTFAFLYVVSIFSIQSYMKNKEPFNLKTPLALWSLSLGVFSILGSLRTVPEVIHLLSKYGLSEAVCADTREDWVLEKPSGWWTFLFIMSKVPELGDTFFIVLRKGKLIPLHWYHHITVMLFCWHCWATNSLYGNFFAAMNFTVHAFMYVFYTLAALGYRPTAYAQSITLIQILQMIAGTAISGYAVAHMLFLQPQAVGSMIFSGKAVQWNHHDKLERDVSAGCKMNPANSVAGFAMYVSYLWLFSAFFYYSYIAPRPRLVESKKVQ